MIAKDDGPFPAHVMRMSASAMIELFGDKASERCEEMVRERADANHQEGLRYWTALRDLVREMLAEGDEKQ